MLLTDEQYRNVWDRVYDAFRFTPSIDTAVTPFVIAVPHEVFDISGSDESNFEQFDHLITDAFIKCTSPGEQLYALDWHHSAFLFDPREPQQMESIYIEDSRYFGGGYHAFFPAYYPDGDYYFFIDKQFRFGYLSHPWRQEVWIFGEKLISEFESVYKKFGWTVKEGL